MSKSTGFNIKDPSLDVPEIPDPPKPEGVILPPKKLKAPRPPKIKDPSVSEVTRAKMSRVRRGQPKSKTTRLKMQVAREIQKMESEFSEEHVAAVRLAYTKEIYHRPGGIALLARHLNLNYPQVYKIVTDRIWRHSDKVGGEPFYGGCLHVIAGPMFSSKTSELFRLIRKAEREGISVLCVKPVVDNRHENTTIMTHDGRRRDAISVESSHEIKNLVTTHKVSLVGIDEVQFFDSDIPEVCNNLVMNNVDVYVAGLNQDYRGIPFGPMPLLLTTADTVDVRVAFCTTCGGPATKSQRIADSEEQVLIGGNSVYEARCRRHWSPQPVFSSDRRMESTED